MKTIQTLIETIKDLIAEATQPRRDYNNMRLIPLPVKNQEGKFPNKNNPA